MNSIVRIALVSAGFCLPFVVQGQQPTEQEYYRCKDAAGQRRFGSSLPAECLGRDTDVVNARGTVLRTIEGEGTRNSRLAEEAEQAERARLKAEQQQRDKVLIETYLTVADIESLRDQRLDLLTAQLKVAEQHIATLRDRLNRLREQSARFRPYNDKPNAPPLPDHIAEDIVGTLKSISVDQQTIDIKQNEQATMTTNFDRDIKRFKELKGIR